MAKKKKNIEELEHVPVEAVSLQDTFDRVVTYSRSHRVQALDLNGNCCYRTPDGKKCWVGCLIPDSMYIPTFEGTDVHKAFVSVKSLVQECMESLGYDAPFLKKLQIIHDWNQPDFWEVELEKLASDFNLKYTKPEVVVL